MKTFLMLGLLVLGTAVRAQVTPVAEAVTPEIQALARGLENDPVRIFNYVHDHIRYVHYFGSIKGAQLTLLEKSGNDFDQCALLVALLRAGGYTNAGYQFGWVLMPYDAPDGSQRDLRHWLGLTLANSDWTVTTNYLHTLFKVYRGYPSNGTERTADTNTFLFQRVWVTLSLGATNYYLDPSFKVSEAVAGINLPDAMQFSSNGLMSAAGGTDGGYSVSNVNEAALRGALTGYTTNLLNYLETNCPNASVLEVWGGRRIVPATNTALSQSLQFPTTNLNGTMPALNWTQLPTNLISTLKVTFAGTNYQCYVPELQGRRLSLVYSNNGLGQLWLDDEKLLEKLTGTGDTNVTLAFTHPAFGAWNPTNNTFIPRVDNPNPFNNANHSSTRSFQRTNAAYALLYAFAPEWGWLRERQRKLDAYLLQGLTNGSRPVLSETLNVMGLNWMLQSFQMEQLLGTRIGVLPFHFHRAGRMAQEAGKGYYVDVFMDKNAPIPAGGFGDEQNRFLGVYAFLGSAMEHGLIEQLQASNLVAASTVKMLQIASTNGQRVFLADSSNWATGPNLQNQVVGYDGPTKGLITTYVNSGYKVLLPQTGTNRVSGESSWSGYGLAVLAGGGLHMLISGGYHGGYVSYFNASVNASYVNLFGSAQPDYFYSTPFDTPFVFGADPVDLTDGTFHVSSTDLALGQAEPRGLTLARYYSGTRRHSNPVGMAAGWLHNYHGRATAIAAPQAGLGGTTPAQMASMMTALTAAVGLYDDAPATAKNWLLTALIAKWAVDQLNQNGVSVTLGQDTLQFVRQPDGRFTPPAHGTLTLSQAANSAFTLQQRHGNTFHFDPLGRLTNVLDRYQQSLQLTYNSSNWVHTATDWKNRTFTFNYTGTPARLTSVTDGTRTVSYGYSTTYSPQGDLTSYTDAEGQTSTYRYDTNHLITATLDAHSRLVVSNVHDALGRVATQYTEGDTNKTWQIFWSGRETVVEDPAGGKERYCYDDASRLVGRQDALGQRTQTVYDGQNHVVMTVSPLNETNRFEYDGRHNLLRSVDALGFTNHFVYDAQDRLTRTVDARGSTNRFGYNTQHSLIGSTNGAGDWVTFGYHADGTLAGVTNAGGATGFGYDATYGQLKSITYPGSLGSEGFLTSPNGDVLSHTNARQFVTSYQYNAHRELTNTIAPTNVTTKVAYDAVGNVRSTSDPRGFTTTNAWSATRKLLITSFPATPQGVPVITNGYDARDWLIRTVNPLHQPTLYTNDAAQRLVSVTDPIQRTTRLGYDAANRKTGATNAAWEATRQQWNQRGELTQTTTPANTTIKRSYDAAGNQITLTNRNGKRWQFQYDAANRLTNTISPRTNETRLAYNDRGLLNTVREPSGQWTTNFYDPKGRLTNIVDGVASRVLRYDANNNVTNIVEGGKTNTWTFDAYDRVQTYKDAEGNLIQYGYDPSGNLTNLVYPGGRAVRYAYDSLNRLTNVTDWANRKTTFVYDLASRLTTIIRPNGTTREIKYDAAGQTTNIMEKMAIGVPIAFWRLNWNAAARVEWEFAAPLPHTNLPPTRTMTFDDDNRLLTFNGNSVTHDADGNLTYAPLTDNTLVSYDYDARNRLRSAGGLSYGYDPAGNRTALTNGADLTRLVINPNAPLSQVLMRVRSGVTNYYIYGLGLLYEVTETASSTNTLTYHFDYRGSTVALSRDNGLPTTDRIEYSAYGSITYRAGTTDTPFLFNGRYGVQTDPNGLLYMRARYYNPYLCRFLNPDPAGFAGGLNFYQFANGNPVNYRDPSGLGAVSDNFNWSWLTGDDFLFGSGAPLDWSNPFDLPASDSNPGFWQMVGNGLNNTVTAMGQTLGFYLYPPGWTSENWNQLGDQFYSMDTPQNPAATPYVVGALGVSGAAAITAGGVGIWGAAGLPTMNVAVGAGDLATSPFHVAYGVGNTWVNAVGSSLGNLTVSPYLASQTAGSAYFTVTGIPIINSAAVTATGGAAWTCVTAAGSAFVRGWLP